jgi:filamentous hemagglutinin
LGADGKPVMTELSNEEKLALKPGASGKLNVFTNGIFNDVSAAANYAVQMSELPSGEDLYFVYYPEANNAVSELLVAGYQKFLEGNIGDLANASEEIKNLLATYGEEGLNLIGHSRGAMTIGNALESLFEENGPSDVLSETTIKFVGPAYNAQEAANLLDWLSGGLQTTVQLQNHADDFVGSLIGGNPATYDQRPSGSTLLGEWLRIFGDAPTVHSCYGSMVVNQEGCFKNYGNPSTIDVPSTPQR